ncbi:hypothetical protein B0O99DRAFT_124949 [Bisporella sp. PMI_857]|nr:hypothetical protein B0O99DRAFT_124949 [Bisporella sp. PMI_857]
MLKLLIVGQENRLKLVESQLAEVLSNQNPADSSLSRYVSASASPLFQQSSALRGQTPHSRDELPTRERILAAAESYLLFCDSQPFPVFHRQSFLQTIHQRDPELQFAILALTSRFMEGSEATNDYFECSRSMVMQRVCDGRVELSTIQSLCLLSLVDFTNGNTKRASMHNSLAFSLAHNAGLSSECRQVLPESVREERRRCFWSLILFKRLHGLDLGILDCTSEENFPWFPESTGKPAQPDPVLLASSSPRDIIDRGIISCEIQLCEIWFKITRYARRRGKPSTLPPWSPQSEYAGIMAQQMELETRMPHVHRFRPAEFSKKPMVELQNNRDYWGPWIMVQFIYHTNLCLLNHPLLLSLRLRNFKSEIPEMFLQSTSDLTCSHASWITHLISMLEAKSFKITDPFLAHCAAIVATILLQESFNPESRSEKIENFTRCLRFIQGFGEWPHVMRMASKLERLRETVVSAYGTDPSRGLLIDLGQFWEILEYASSSELSGLKSIFGPTLQLGEHRTTTELAHTSSLPPPTRVDAQDFAGTSHPQGGSTVVTPFLYSDDELAVLAESLFQQHDPTQGMNGVIGMNDWWSTGNL